MSSPTNPLNNTWQVEGPVFEIFSKHVTAQKNGSFCHPCIFVRDKIPKKTPLHFSYMDISGQFIINP